MNIERLTIKEIKNTCINELKVLSIQDFAKENYYNKILKVIFENQTKTDEHIKFYIKNALNEKVN